MHGIRMLNNTSHMRLEDAYPPHRCSLEPRTGGAEGRTAGGTLQNDAEQLLGSVDHVIGAGALELRTAAKAPCHAT